MKKMWALSTCIIVLLLSFNINVNAGDGTGLSFGTDIAFNSKYLWRGIESNEDPVFQPDVWMSYGGLTATVWGNLELTNVHNNHDGDGDTGDFTEVDYTLDYSGSFDKLNYSLGYIYYDFPHTGFTDTHELYVSAGYDALLSPTLTVYRDLRSNDGFYITVGLSHDIELKQLFGSTFSTSATVGYATKRMTKYYYGERKDTFTDILVSAELSVPVTSSIAVIPAVHYSGLLDEGIRDKGVGDKNDNLWFGINIAFSWEI